MSSAPMQASNEDGRSYRVEEITDIKITVVDGCEQATFLTKWQGYRQPTWEPLDNFDGRTRNRAVQRFKYRNNAKYTRVMERVAEMRKQRTIRKAAAPAGSSNNLAPQPPQLPTLPATTTTSQLAGPSLPAFSPELLSSEAIARLNRQESRKKARDATEKDSEERAEKMGKSDEKKAQVNASSDEDESDGSGPSQSAASSSTPVQIPRRNQSSHQRSISPLPPSDLPVLQPSTSGSSSSTRQPFPMDLARIDTSVSCRAASPSPADHSLVLAVPDIPFNSPPSSSTAPHPRPDGQMKEDTSSRNVHHQPEGHLSEHSSPVPANESNGATSTETKTISNGGLLPPALCLENLLASLENDDYAIHKMLKMELEARRAPMYNWDRQEKLVGVMDKVMRVIKKTKPVTFMATVFEGKPLLHYAVLLNNDKLVRMLIMDGAPVDQEDSDGFTEVQVAGRHHCSRAIWSLILHGANPSELLRKWAHPDSKIKFMCLGGKMCAEMCLVGRLKEVKYFIETSEWFNRRYSFVGPLMTMPYDNKKVISFNWPQFQEEQNVRYWLAILIMEPHFDLPRFIGFANPDMVKYGDKTISADEGEHKEHRRFQVEPTVGMNHIQVIMPFVAKGWEASQFLEMQLVKETLRN